MILRTFITAWRARAPWSSDAQVEQDLVVCRTVVDLLTEPLLVPADLGSKWQSKQPSTDTFCDFDVEFPHRKMDAARDLA